jgi:hypothetical protein
MTLAAEAWGSIEAARRTLERLYRRRALAGSLPERFRRLKVLAYVA